MSLDLFNFFQVFLAPPLYRSRPAWYQQNLTQVATRFSSIFSTEIPANLSLLPSFSSQDLLPDGVFLSPVSGLHYMLHIFDQTDTLLSSRELSGTAQFSQVKEAVRHHEDRMVFLESRSEQLQKRFSRKIAVDSEFDDWVTNRSEEDWLVVRGLPRLAKMTDREWQDAARRQVAEMIRLILKVNKVRDLEFTVLYVGNPLKHQKSGPTLYNVRLDSVYSSQRIRTIFSGFFRHGRPVDKPSSLKFVEVRNKVTLETKIRISILRQLGSIWKEANPGSDFKVKGFEPGPVLVTFPARGSSDRPRTYNFVQAATTLNASFADEHLVRIFQNVKNHHQGNLRSLFLVIDDDDRERCLQLVQADQAKRQRGPSSSAVTTSGFVSGSGAGMDVEALRASIRSPPPPPAEKDHRHHSDSDVSRHEPKGREGRGRSRGRSDRDPKSTKGLKRVRISSSESRSRSPPRKGKKSKKKKEKRSRRSPSSSPSTSSGSSPAKQRKY